ncbi:MAG: type II secretion system protein [Planctomycetota bacterium]
MTKRKESPRFRPSFTLVELLVAIAILGTMVGMVLYSLAGAQTDARVARSRSTISKINEIVLARWEEYRYRAVNVNLGNTAGVNLREQIATGDSKLARVSRVPPGELARIRMLMLRDWMRMEMPDRVSDLLYGPSEYTVAYRTGAGTLGAVKLFRPLPPGWGVMYAALRNRVHGLRDNSDYQAEWDGFDMPDINGVTFLPSSTGGAPYYGGTYAASGDPITIGTWNAKVQSSELLYLLVSTSNLNGASALEYFRPTEVGDADNDGLLEFHDAWGQPIVWLRWPAGYNSDLVRYAGSDAMDPLETDWRFRDQIGTEVMDEDWKPRTLVPLILSAGQDAQLGVILDFVNNAGSVDDPSDDVPIVYARMTWPTARPGTPFGTAVYNVAGPHFFNPVVPYYYPDPHFTYDYSSQTPNGPNCTKPWNIDDAPGELHGFRRNQIGSVPNFLDFSDTPQIENTFAEDNITNHDIILEP